MACVFCSRLHLIAHMLVGAERRHELEELLGPIGGLALARFGVGRGDHLPHLGVAHVARAHALQEPLQAGVGHAPRDRLEAAKTRRDGGG